ncbi:hypothetical protein NDU88_008465 [Pleurodeles waltl]|uniref:Uncharacterized protein n=1 Tax=Pleurodeles waltl TaxID=8319 RepID=A0AAV7PQG3_PLEWA|nr:hypothetical protein NDU88_008465 [Pleurodeles waltl]
MSSSKAKRNKRGAKKSRKSRRGKKRRPSPRSSKVHEGRKWRRRGNVQSDSGKQGRGKKKVPRSIVCRKEAKEIQQESQAHRDADGSCTGRTRVLKEARVSDGEQPEPQHRKLEGEVGHGTKSDEDTGDKVRNEKDKKKRHITKKSRGRSYVTELSRSRAEMESLKSFKSEKSSGVTPNSGTGVKENMSNPRETITKSGQSKSKKARQVDAEDMETSCKGRLTKPTQNDRKLTCMSLRRKARVRSFDEASLLDSLKERAPPNTEIEAGSNEVKKSYSEEPCSAVDDFVTSVQTISQSQETEDVASQSSASEREEEERLQDEEAVEEANSDDTEEEDEENEEQDKRSQKSQESMSESSTMDGDTSSSENDSKQSSGGSLNEEAGQKNSDLQHPENPGKKISQVISDDESVKSERSGCRSNIAMYAMAEEDQDGEEGQKVEKRRPRGVTGKKPLPIGVKSKLLNIGMSKACQKKGAKGSTSMSSVSNLALLKGGKTLTELFAKKKKESPPSELADRTIDTIELDQEGRNYFPLERSGESATVLTGKEKHRSLLTNQSKLILNLKSRHELAKTKLLSKECHEQLEMTGRVVSGPEEPEGDLPKKETEQSPNPQLLKDKKEPSFSSISSISSAEKTVEESPLICKKKKMKKVIVKVKMASPKKAEVRKVEDEEITVEFPTERIPKVTQKGSNALNSISAFRRVTGWFKQRPGKKVNLKRRFASAARAIGITEWLIRKFTKKKKRGMPAGFRRRMAMRIVNTAGLVNRLSRPSPSGAGELRGISGNKDRGTGESPEATEELEADLNLHSTQCRESQVKNSDGFVETEEKANTADAKYAIVFPRVHNLVTSKKVPSERNEMHQKHFSKAFAARKAVMSVQPGYKSKSLMAQNSRKVPLEHSFETEGPDPSLNILHERQPVSAPYKLSRLGNVSPEVGNPLVGKRASKSNSSILKEERLLQSQNPHPAFSPVQNGLVRVQNRPPQQEEESAEEDVGSYFEEDADEEATDVLQQDFYETTAHVHWAQSHGMRCDPTTWLNSETLLPRRTVENLSKWTMYHDHDFNQPHRSKVSQERWEAEDVMEGILEMNLTHQQVHVDETRCVEVEEVEDLSRLEMLLPQ